MLTALPNPHLVLHLDVKPEECSKRIQIRKRSFESDIPMEYLTGLSACYDKWLRDMEKTGTPVLRLDWNRYGCIDKVSEVLKNALQKSDGDIRWRNPQLREYVGNRNKIAETCKITEEDIQFLPEANEWNEDLLQLKSWEDIDLSEEINVADQHVGVNATPYRTGQVLTIATHHQ